MTDLAAAHRFMVESARPVERCVYRARFEEGDTADVVAAVMAFRNEDGGFGNGLEPDKLVPDSQALDVEIAFERLAAVGASAPDVVTAACDWLQTIADESGAVPVLMPNSNNHPRAGHWNAPAYPPGVNPTAAIVGHAHRLGVQHEWVDRATAYCFSILSADTLPAEGHDLLGLTKFLGAVPDRERAMAAAPAVSAAIKTASFVKYDAHSDDYGVTPLDYAPAPNSFAAAWFPAAVVDGHLDALEAAQADDGGWPVNWQPPTPASHQAWRGIRTLHALETLRAHNRG